MSSTDIDVPTQPSEESMHIAAQCWCDPRTSDRVMDAELATVFAEKLDEFRDALIWCSGSADFGHGGQAHKGWMKVCDTLLRPRPPEKIDNPEVATAT